MNLVVIQKLNNLFTLKTQRSGTQDMLLSYFLNWIDSAAYQRITFMKER